MPFNEKIQPEIKILSSFTHPHVIQNLMPFTLVENEQTQYVSQQLCCLAPTNELTGRLTFRGLFSAVQALLYSPQFLNRYFGPVLPTAVWQCPTLPVQFNQI